MGWPRIFAAFLVLELLAGCSGGDSSPEGGVLDETGPAADLAEFSETTGGLGGRVVDDGLAPLIGVAVRLVELDLLVATGVEGEYGFGFLTPGEYTVTADATGYQTGTTQVAVSAGEFTEANFVLERLPSQAPYSELTIRKGFWTCAVAAIVAVPNCEAVVTAGHGYQFTVGPNWNASIIELAWRYSNPGQATTPGAWFSNFGSKPGRSTQDYCFGEAFGQNPVRVRFTPNLTLRSGGCGVTSGGVGNPFPAEPYRHSGYAFPWGLLSNETQPASSPLNARSRGVGTSLSQPFTLYGSVFYFGPPPTDFTAIPDQ